MFSHATAYDVDAVHTDRMAVIQFRNAQESRPTLITVFGVRAYWNDRGNLAEGKLQQFANMESALRAGAQAALRAPAVRVFRIRGNVEADYWEELVTVAKYGTRANELLGFRS